MNTVVCAENYTEIETLAEFMWHNFRLDGQYFNIVRGETLVGEEIKQVPPDVLPGCTRTFRNLPSATATACLPMTTPGKRFVKNVAYVGTITTHYRTQHANFDRSTPGHFPARPAKRLRSSITTATCARVSCAKNSRP